MGCGSSTELVLPPSTRTKRIYSFAPDDSTQRVHEVLRMRPTEPELEPIDMKLLRAAINGYLPEVKFVVENNALTNELSDALICAANTGHLDVVEYLCEHGANTGLVRERDTTALMTAAEHGRIKIVQYLVGDWGVDLHTRCSDGLTALHYAAATDHVDVVNLLLTLGAPVDDRIGPSKNAAILGMTPLHVAASAGSSAVFATLMQHGADIDAVSASGDDVMKFALDGGDREMVATIKHLQQSRNTSY
ncbi:Serine/threonine protein kinase, partial [Globisporangium splendens]